jgi:pyruvate formate lyase activating enzyme
VLGLYDRGDCKVRVNIDGELATLTYGYACSANIDPVEKKPLFHFLPGTSIFSIATAGCNLHCKFCQNWQISQFQPEEVRYTYLPPDDVVRKAISNNCPSIAYTYSEPSIFFEYMLETAKLAKEKGLKNAYITALYLNEEPLRELSKFIDSANVDLKSIRDDYYRDVCDGTLEPILKGLEILQEEGVWTEVTNLLLPILNDSDKDIRDLCRWIKTNLGENVPIHFSRFYPTYKLKNLPPTPVPTLTRASEIAKAEGLQYVYVGNVPGHQGEKTHCPDCGEVVLDRRGFFLVEDTIDSGKCGNCGKLIDGVFE